MPTIVSNVSVYKRSLSFINIFYKKRYYGLNKSRNNKLQSVACCCKLKALLMCKWTENKHENAFIS